MLKPISTSFNYLSRFVAKWSMNRLAAAGRRLRLPLTTCVDRFNRVFALIGPCSLISATLLPWNFLRLMLLSIDFLSVSCSDIIFFLRWVIASSLTSAL